MYSFSLSSFQCFAIEKIKKHFFPASSFSSLPVFVVSVVPDSTPRRICSSWGQNWMLFPWNATAFSINLHLVRVFQLSVQNLIYWWKKWTVSMVFLQSIWISKWAEALGPKQSGVPIGMRKARAWNKSPVIQKDRRSWALYSCEPAEWPRSLSC